MALSTYMILYPPNVAIFPSETSINGISGFATTGSMFGSVYMINPNCVRTSVGNDVVFKIKDAQLVTIANDIFYIVDENDITFKQVPPEIM